MNHPAQTLVACTGATAGAGAVRALGALLLGAALLGVAAAQAAPTEVVQIETGKLQGVVEAGVQKFLGIPYAARPVGALRWQPPQAPAAWSDVRQANQFGPFCPQQQRGVFAAPSTTEDCLYLNVFAPQAATGGARRAVMVWFYGGGLYSGESNDYDASKLVSRGDVLVVTLNYRVGALGFLSHPALNGEGHAAVNYGIMDQQFALKWVHDNIAAFGGDPDNVTIFGQSGGGTSVMANLASPLSKGLFHRAINQSGTRVAITKPETMLQCGQDFAAAVGCADKGAACLRALTVEQVLDKQAVVTAVVSDFPSVDGQVIRRRAYETFDDGDFNRVPIFTGLVQDEQAFFMPELRTKKPLTDEEYKKYAASFGAVHADKLLTSYPLAKYSSPTLAEIAMSQGSKACTARMLNRAWAKYVPLYSFEFRDRTAPSYFPATSYPMGAYHTAELQYLFPLFRGGQGTAHPLSAAQEKLSDRMVDYWTSFARTGVPTAAGAVAAPKFDAAKDDLLVLDLAGPKVEEGYGVTNNCALWDTILSYR